MSNPPQTGLSVFGRAGAESGGWLVRHVTGRKTFQVAGEERHHLMMVDDFQQIRPTDWLPGKRLDPIAAHVFLWATEAGQHRFTFRRVGCTARLHACLSMLESHASGKSCSGFLKKVIGRSQEGVAHQAPAAWGGRLVFPGTARR